jgi:hypothetical protein
LLEHGECGEYYLAFVVFTMCIVIGLSPQKSRFDPRSVPVGFVVDKEVL